RLEAGSSPRALARGRPHHVGRSVSDRAVSDPVVGLVHGFNEVQRSPFDLVKDQADVLSENSDKEKLYPGGERQSDHERRPPQHTPRAEEVRDNLRRSQDQAERGQGNPENRADPERRFRERTQSGGREAEESPDIEFRQAASALLALKRQIDEVEPDPEHEASKKRVLLAELRPKDLGDAVRQQAKVG